MTHPLPPMTHPTSRATHLSDALISIAIADHYMVGLVEPVTTAELHEAEQILISRQNALSEDTSEWVNADRALDLLNHFYREMAHTNRAENDLFFRLVLEEIRNPKSGV